MPTTSTSSYIKAVVAGFVVLVAGDMLWHNVLLGDFYATRLAVTHGDTVIDPTYILIFEAIAAFITARFVLRASSSMGEAALNGLLLGLLLSVAINAVGHTIVAAWDMTMALVDTAWGAILGVIAGPVVYWAAGRS